MNEVCSSCPAGKDRVGFDAKPGLLTTALLVLLPKCPFCILAYSSTLVMCGKDSLFSDVRHHQSGLTIAITASLSALVLLSIAFNYRDRRSLWAMMVVALGSGLSVWSTVRGGGEYLYYAGVSMIALGVWLNGSLLYVWRRISGTQGSAARIQLQKGFP
jgi:hypothetical protein